MQATETVLMYVALATSVVQHFLLDALTVTLVLVAVGGWIIIVIASNSYESSAEQPQKSIWDGVVRCAQYDWLCNCVCSLLVPLAVVLSTIVRTQYENETSYSAFLLTLALSQALGAAMTLWLVVTPSGCYENQDKDIEEHLRRESVRNAITWSVPIVSCFIAVNSYVFGLGVVACMVQSVALMTQSILQSHLPLWCPRNFTFGEAAVISQGITFYLGSTLSNLLQKYDLIFEVSEVSTAVCDTNMYMEVAVLCCGIVVMATFMFAWCRSVLGFYVTFALVMGLVAVPLLLVLLEENFILWTISYVTSNKMKKRLFIYWAECCIVGAVIVVTFSGVLGDLVRKVTTFIQSRFWRDERRSTTKSAPNDGHSSEHESGVGVVDSRVSTSIRKLFHLLAVAIFVPGAMKEPIMTCVAGTCCLVVFIMMETMRLAEIPPLHWPLQQTFTLFLDDQDQGPVILTHMYLLVGCLLPLWLYPTQSGPSHIAMYAGVISLGVGDTMAAIIGSSYGTHQWKGTRRTKEGTAAGVVAQCIFICFLNFQNAFVIEIDWRKTGVAVALTSLVEAHTSHVDNLILPLLMYSLLL